MAILKISVFVLMSCLYVLPAGAAQSLSTKVFQVSEASDSVYIIAPTGARCSVDTIHGLPEIVSVEEIPSSKTDRIFAVQYQVEGGTRSIYRVTRLLLIDSAKTKQKPCLLDWIIGIVHIAENQKVQHLQRKLNWSKNKLSLTAEAFDAYPEQNWMYQK